MEILDMLRLDRKNPKLRKISLLDHSHIYFFPLL